MEKKEQYKRLVKFVASTVILLILTLVYAYVWHTCYAYNPEVLIEPFWHRGNFVIIGLYAVIMFLFFKVYGGFKIGYFRLLEILYSQILSVLCVNIITYLQLCLIGHWRFLSYVMPIVYMTVVDMIIIIMTAFLTQWIYFKIYPARKMVLVYGKYNPKYLNQKISSRQDKYTIAKTVSINEGIEQIKEYIVQYNCVILSDIPAELRNNLLKFTYERGIRCYIVPKISDVLVMGATNINLFDTPLLLLRNQGLTFEQEFFKRCFDIIASLVAIILSSPIMLLVAGCIKAYDHGPVFFVQERLTKDGQVFNVIKFRSMLVTSDQNEYQLTQKDDNRVTPIGKIIRAIHIDELPQLFNILKGEMSFVGPRPECPDITEEYANSIPEFKYRLKVKAGLTGFAQVYGKYNTTPYDKLKLDLSYIVNYSFILDVKLMLLTLKIIFLKEKTEGIESWQTNALIHEEDVGSESIL